MKQLQYTTQDNYVDVSNQNLSSMIRPCISVQLLEFDVNVKVHNVAE